MKFLITGQAGMIARNLTKVLRDKKHEVVSDVELFDGINYKMLSNTREACIHSNAEDVWFKALYENDIDTVIHNAAVVGTDVVALNPEHAVLSNVQGTHNIVRAANRANCGVCYLGTTVIYDTQKYQDEPITELSDKLPRTYYGIQKLAAEQIVTSMAKRWAIVRPLFAYGGMGDMNSLVAKTIYAQLQSIDSVDMFLDPEKVKDYLHVTDFCKAVELVCRDVSGRGWGTDWNVAAETPIPAGDVVSEVYRQMGCSDQNRIKWHRNTDYLGNHRLSSEKIRNILGWKPELDLSEGIQQTLEWIKTAVECGDYNPLKYIAEAQSKGIDLQTYFPK